MLRNGIRLLITSKPVRWLIIAPMVAVMLYGVSAAALWGLYPASPLAAVAPPPQATADYRPWGVGLEPPVPTEVAAEDWPDGSLDLGEPLGPQPEAGRPLPTTAATPTVEPEQGVITAVPTARVLPPPVQATADKAQPTPLPDVVIPTDTQPPPVPVIPTRTPVPPTARPTDTALPVPTNTFPPPTVFVPTDTAPPPTIAVPTVAPPTMVFPTDVPPTAVVPTSVPPTVPVPTDTPLPLPTNTPPPTVEPDVTLCHRPVGNPDNAHTIVVKPGDVAGHLAHGDSLGPCP